MAKKERSWDSVATLMEEMKIEKEKQYDLLISGRITSAQDRTLRKKIEELGKRIASIIKSLEDKKKQDENGVQQGS